MAARGSNDPLGALEWQWRESPALLPDEAATLPALAEGGAAAEIEALVDALLPS